jgi:hypothetical protein
MNQLGTHIVLFFSLFGLSMQGYIYKDDFKALRKWNSTTNRYHYWIGFPDFHDKTHKANIPQRKKIEELLPQTNPAQTLVLVEDLSSANDDGRLGCGAYFINSRAGILAGLGSFCKNNNIPYKNVEYRYCRVVTLGPIINNITADPALFPSTKNMSLSHLLQEIEQTYTDLLLGNHTDRFKTVFLEKSRAITRSMEKLNLMRNNTKTIAEYVSTSSTPLNRLDTIKNLLTFDGILIGFKLVSATMKAQNKEKILAFAGGTHIREAYELLQAIDGYEPVTSTNSTDSKAILLRSISGPLFDGGLGTKPDPLSLELLEHYLKD